MDRGLQGKSLWTAERSGADERERDAGAAVRLGKLQRGTIAGCEQRRRILRRNGDRAEMFFRRWIPLEERYFREMNVEQRCDFVFLSK